MKLSTATYSKIREAGLDRSIVEQALGKRIVENLADQLADQGGWPMNEHLKVHGVDQKEDRLLLTCTFQFDEVVSCGCGRSMVPHIHTIELQILESGEVEIVKN